MYRKSEDAPFVCRHARRAHEPGLSALVVGIQATARRLALRCNAPLHMRDQLRRAHVRRSLGGDACCDEGYSSSGSDSDGGQGSSVRASAQSPEGAAALGAGVPL